MSRGQNVASRFWEKVDRTGPCWIWTACAQGGYGYFRLFGKSERAHRIAWELTNSEPIAGFHVLHECDNSLCVNPEHLRLGTHAENMADMAARGRARNRFLINPPTHCPQGHPYSGDNLYVKPHGGRECRQCNHDRQAARGRMPSVIVRAKEHEEEK